MAHPPSGARESGLRGGASISYNTLILTMFAVGMLTHHATSDVVPRKAASRAFIALVVAWSLTIVLIVPRLERVGESDPTRLCQLISFGVGYALFFGFLAFRERQFPRWLTYLGEISYSVYLIHGVMFTLGLPGGPFQKGATIVLLTLLISPLTYLFVEKTGVTIGRRLTRRPETRLNLGRPIPEPRE